MLKFVLCACVLVLFAEARRKFHEPVEMDQTVLQAAIPEKQETPEFAQGQGQTELDTNDIVARYMEHKLYDYTFMDNVNTEVKQYML
ncbi:hypothetical protein EMCRGX_G010704 [Ephydatia muelleri]